MPEQIRESTGVPVTAGAVAEDRIIQFVKSYVALLSRPAEIRTFVEPGSASLTVRFRAGQFIAVIARNPNAIGLMTGSGLTTPTYP